MKAKTLTIQAELKCTIRLLGPGDIEGLVAVKPDASLHEGRLGLQRDGKACYIGAIVNGAPVGFVLLSLKDKTAVHPFTNGAFCADMIDLLVCDPLQNLGIGTALIRYAEAVCRERGIEFIGLDVNPEQGARAEALYSRLGYKRVGERHIDGTYKWIDKNGKEVVFEDWCFDMIKPLGDAAVL